MGLVVLSCEWRTGEPDCEWAWFCVANGWSANGLAIGPGLALRLAGARMGLRLGLANDLGLRAIGLAACEWTSVANCLKIANGDRIANEVVFVTECCD